MLRMIVSVCIAVLLGVIPGTLVVKESFAKQGYVDDVNAFCPSQPLTSTSCSSCHDDSAAWDAFSVGDYCFFCPDDAPCIPGPTCTDLDQDGYAPEGGDCGPVDCDDADASVNPGVMEDCTDRTDNNCNGLVDAADPNAVDCPALCTDADRDLYSMEGGACGPVDCDDADASVNPGAMEDCTDRIDNNCNGMVDAADPNAVDCPSVCSDVDGDLYGIEGGACGPVDCDDADASVNPGAVENCTDEIDNNCNGLIDADDPSAIGCLEDCTDADGDEYNIEGGACGPVDCDDADASVHPGARAREVCTDGIDNNCNGLVDTADPNAVGCPFACTDADGDLYSVEGGDCGPVDCNDTDASVHPGAKEVCKDRIDNNCNGKIDRTDKACKKQGKQKDCDDDREECDDDERESGERDDGERDSGKRDDDEDGNSERNYRRDNYSAEEENVRALEALHGAPAAGCTMIPESMGHRSPGGMFFMYSLVAGYIGIVRRLVRRKAGDRKDRFPGTGEEGR